MSTAVPLTPQVITVPLFAGQDSSTDPRVLDVSGGNNAILENVRISRIGQAQKRFGFNAASTRRSDGTQLAAGQQVFSSSNALFQYDGQELSNYSTSANVWKHLGNIQAPTVQQVGTIQTINDVIECSSANANGFTFVAWTEGTQVLFTCVDNATGSPTISRAIVSTNGDSPNIVPFGDQAFIFWTQRYPAVGIKYAIFSTISGTGLGIAYDVNSLSGYIGGYAVTYDSYNDRIVGAFDNQVAGSNGPLTLIAFSAANVQTTLAAFPTLAYTYGAPLIVSVAQVTADSTWYGFNNNTAIFTTGYTTRTGPSTAYPIQKFTGTSLQVFFTVTDTGGGQGIAAATLSNPDGDGSVTLTPTGNIRWQNSGGFYLLSQAFQIGGGNFVWVLADAQFQSKVFMFDSNLNVVGALLLNGEGSPREDPQTSFGTSFPASLTLNSLSTFSADTSNNYWLALRRRGSLEFNAQQQAFTPNGLVIDKISYTQPYIFNATLNNLTYMSGLAPQIYDGTNLTEWGYYSFPNVSSVIVNGSGGALAGGTYFVAVVYGWYDASGNLWRSAPSFTSQVNNVPAGGTIQIFVDNPTVTSKQNVFAEYYCTANISSLTGSVLYKVGQVTCTSNLPTNPNVYVGPQGWIQFFTVSAADTSIETGEPLYTTGGYPDYLSVPALNYLSTSGFRIYGISGEDTACYASTPISPGQPGQILDSQYVTLATTRAPINSCEVMDGNLYLGTYYNWYVTNSDVSALSETVITFQPPLRLAIAGGVINPSSILNTADGLYYQNERGIQLLSRQQSLLFVGEPMKNYASQQVLASYVIQAQQQFRFVLDDKILCYDWLRQGWSQYTFTAAPQLIGGCLWQDVGVLATPDGVVRIEKENYFFDDLIPITRRIETPWIKPGGLAGWGRTWRFMILGELRSPHTLQVRIAYQYSQTATSASGPSNVGTPDWVDTLQIDSTAVSGAPAWGQGLGTFGRLINRIPSGFGNNFAGNAYQFVGIMPKQKAGSFKFEITDQNSTGEDSALNVLALLVGVYAKISQVPTWKKFG